MMRVTAPRPPIPLTLDEIDDELREVRADATMSDRDRLEELDKLLDLRLEVMIEQAAR